MLTPHGPRFDKGADKALWWAFGLNAAFLVIEAVGGILTGSLALLSDAGHMVSDVGALGIALVASRIARRHPTTRRTYGYGRAEVLAALLNGLTLWLIVGAISLEAVKRLLNPPTVKSGVMLVVATAGLVANLASAVILFRHRGHNLNLRGAFLHLAADTMSSVGVVFAGILMWRFGWFLADPIASFLIAAFILAGSWSLIKESVNVLLEGAPLGLDIEEVRAGLERVEGVDSCHDLHIWSIGSGEPILTAHLTVHPEADRSEVLKESMELIEKTYGIGHITLQVEKEPCEYSRHT